MSFADSCGICSGPLRLLYRGAGLEARAEAFSPTNHRPGQYGDLYRCADCGTVQQPSLPRGDALLDLYRAMRDEHYLDEEQGRRRTARRLLGTIGRYVPSGRLLDVGCGHGLLLDEARRASYEPEGLEVSRYAAEPEPPEYAAIVLADVFEHLDEPLAAIDRCMSLLAPGGVLCLVTPDPASRTARLAGPGWWGYLPAHTYLVPRATLRRLLDDRGLDVVDDRSLVRSFTLRYWMAGLAERGGALGTGVAALRRLAPGRVAVSLSLGDETVMVARKGARAGARSARAAATGPAVPVGN